MKKIVKNGLIYGLILSILISIMWATHVMAYSFNMVATPSTTTLKPGETITITLGLKDIDAGEAGINTVEAQISYDSDVFEKVTDGGIKSENSWSLTYNGEVNGGKLLGVILVSGVKENQDSIGSITLKAKKEISKKETTIKISDITTNEGTTLITDTDKEIKLKIEENISTPVEKTDDTKATEIPAKQPDQTTATKKIPAAGKRNMLIIAIISILLISVLFSKHEINKMKRW